jgi:bifunctional DNA-binding transcriptional regulator/antitoxin component of YhaV-PrlF toxin-antitoxin module
MPIRVERKLFRTGEGGVAVTLPKAWVNYFRLQPGDVVEIIGNGELVIRIKASPEKKPL